MIHHMSGPKLHEIRQRSEAQFLPVYQLFQLVNRCKKNKLGVHIGETLHTKNFTLRTSNNSVDIQKCSQNEM